MKNIFQKPSPAMMLIYMGILVTCMGSFRTSLGCKLSTVKQKVQQESTIEKPASEAAIPVLNPLQIITAKFL